MAIITFSLLWDNPDMSFLMHLLSDKSYSPYHFQIYKQSCSKTVSFSYNINERSIIQFDWKTALHLFWNKNLGFTFVEI